MKIKNQAAKITVSSLSSFDKTKIIPIKPKTEAKKFQINISYIDSNEPINLLAFAITEPVELFEKNLL
jgi:hypothetical protein